MARKFSVMSGAGAASQGLIAGLNIGKKTAREKDNTTQALNSMLRMVAQEQINQRFILNLTNKMNEFNIKQKSIEEKSDKQQYINSIIEMGKNHPEMSTLFDNWTQSEDRQKLIIGLRSKKGMGSKYMNSNELAGFSAWVLANSGDDSEEIRKKLGAFLPIKGLEIGAGNDFSVSDISDVVNSAVTNTPQAFKTMYGRENSGIKVEKGIVYRLSAEIWDRLKNIQIGGE